MIAYTNSQPRRVNSQRIRHLAIILASIGLINLATIHLIPNARAGSFNLVGSILAPAGWGFTANTITSPGPDVVVAPGETVSLAVSSDDANPHNWGVDYNGNGIHDAGEPLSNSTGTTTHYTFTATTTTGTYTYWCFIHKGPMTGKFIVTTPDVGVSGIVTSRTFAYSGTSSNPIQVNVTANNLGATSQTFFVSAKANTTLIGNQTVTIAAGQNTVVSFQWNAALLPRGSYILTAQATKVPGETNTGNNAITDATRFTDRFKGDINGDCRVNIIDLSSVGASFGTSPPSNINSDVNNDGTVNIIDLSNVGSVFGLSC